MAIQDFIAGGFYGKLGAMVGQRYYNTRFVRAYVIPNDPKTEKQQAWRSTFAAGIAATHISAAMDWGSVLFQSSELSAQNLRAAAALAALKDGVTGLSVVPLTAYGESPAYPITGLYAINTESNGAYLIPTPAVPTSSDFNVSIALWDGTTPATLDNTEIIAATYSQSLQCVVLTSAQFEKLSNAAAAMICSITDPITADDYVASTAITPVVSPSTISLGTVDFTEQPSATTSEITTPAISWLCFAPSIVSDEVIITADGYDSTDNTVIPETPLGTITLTNIYAYNPEDGTTSGSQYDDAVYNIYRVSIADTSATTTNGLTRGFYFGGIVTQATNASKGYFSMSVVMSEDLVIAIEDALQAKFIPLLPDYEYVDGQITATITATLA